MTIQIDNVLLFSRLTHKPNRFEIVFRNIFYFFSHPVLYPGRLTCTVYHWYRRVNILHDHDKSKMTHITRSLILIGVEIVRMVLCGNNCVTYRRPIRNVLEKMICRSTLEKIILHVWWTATIVFSTVLMTVKTIKMI